MPNNEATSHHDYSMDQLTFDCTAGDRDELERQRLVMNEAWWSCVSHMHQRPGVEWRYPFLAIDMCNSE